MTKALLFCTVTMAATPRLAHADGWIHCSGPDSSCNAGGSASVGAGLLLIAGVTYALGRRRRR